MCGFCREADAGNLVVASFYITGIGLGTMLGPEVFASRRLSAIQMVLEGRLVVLDWHNEQLS